MSLVNDLLDLTRMESGKLELHCKPLDITLLIRELLPSFQPGWDARRQTFTLHLPEKAPKVLGDAERVITRPRPVPPIASVAGLCAR